MGVRVKAIASIAVLDQNTIRGLQRNPELAKRMLGRIKLGQFAQPSDKVGAVIFLTSPTSEFLTGHTLFVDGEWSTSTC